MNLEARILWTARDWIQELIGLISFTCVAKTPLSCTVETYESYQYMDLGLLPEMFLLSFPLSVLEQMHKRPLL